MAKERILQFLNEKISTETPIQEGDNIFELGLVNSLFALQLITFLESEFKLVVANEDLKIENFSSANNISDFLLSK
ncbi:MAG: acyl carrier protein [Bacteroidota bacterium]